MQRKFSAYKARGETWMVPCSISHKTNTFSPLVTPKNQCFDIAGKRQPWLLAEDDQLKLIAEALHMKNWPLVAKQLNEAVHKGLPIRQAKQCRERYCNHLKAGLNKSKWTDQEDDDLKRLQCVHGNKWSTLAFFFPGRTENQIKNRFRLLQLRQQKALS